MKYYIGLSSYDERNIDYLCKHSDVKGVILGDLFCEKRMFDIPSYDIFFYIKKLNSHGKKVVYQTPMYITDDELEKQNEVLLFLRREKIKATILVQDIGVACYLHDKYSDFDIIWSRMGRNRLKIESMQLYDFLKDLNINSVETDDVELLLELYQRGIKPLLVDGNLNFMTIGKYCYSVFQYSVSKMECNRICNNKGNYMNGVDNHLSMEVNGYILGENYHYLNTMNPENNILQDPIMLYVKDIVQMEERMKFWNS